MPHLTWFVAWCLMSEWCQRCQGKARGFAALDANGWNQGPWSGHRLVSDRLWPEVWRFHETRYWMVLAWRHLMKSCIWYGFSQQLPGCSNSLCRWWSLQLRTVPIPLTLHFGDLGALTGNLTLVSRTTMAGPKDMAWDVSCASNQKSNSSCVICACHAVPAWYYQRRKAIFTPLQVTVWEFPFLTGLWTRSLLSGSQCCAQALGFHLSSRSVLAISFHCVSPHGLGCGACHYACETVRSPHFQTPNDLSWRFCYKWTRPPGLSWNVWFVLCPPLSLQCTCKMCICAGKGGGQVQASCYGSIWCQLHQHHHPHRHHCPLSSSHFLSLSFVCIFLVCASNPESIDLPLPFWGRISHHILVSLQQSWFSKNIDVRPSASVFCFSTHVLVSLQFTLCFQKYASLPETSFIHPLSHRTVDTGSRWINTLFRFHMYTHTISHLQLSGIHGHIPAS